MFVVLFVSSFRFFYFCYCFLLLFVCLFVCLFLFRLFGVSFSSLNAVLNRGILALLGMFYNTFT